MRRTGGALISGQSPARRVYPLRAGSALLARLVACSALVLLGVGAAATPAEAGQNLTYHGGPVLHQTTTHLIFLETPELVLTPTYEEQISQYLADVAADSGSNPAFQVDSHVPGVPTGRPSNPYSVDTQYYQIQEGNVVNPVEYNQVFGGAVTTIDRTGSNCKVPSGALVCYSEGQIEAVVESVLASHPSLHRGFFDTYFLILPPGVETCSKGETECGPYAGGSKEETCGNHSSLGSGGGGNNTVIYGVIFNASGDCGVKARKWPTPNGTAADGAISFLSHEQNEMLTSPQVPDHSFLGSLVEPGWWVGEPIEILGIHVGENQIAEIGDQCVERGPKLGENGLGEYDVLINHHPYEIQPEWSNEAGGCVMNTAKAPTAAFSPSEAHTLENVEFNGSASNPNDDGGYIIKYNWEWDGSEAEEVTPVGAGDAANPTVRHTFFTSGPHTVKLTVTNDAGRQSTITKTINVALAQPQLTLIVPNSDYNDKEGEWTAKLTIPNGSLPGAVLKLSFPNEKCEGEVNGSGEVTQRTATCTVTSGQPAVLPPGSYLALAELEALPGLSSRAAALTSFTVSPEETRLEYVGPATFADGQPATLGVQLVTDDLRELVSPHTQTVELTLGGSAGYPAQTCKAEYGPPPGNELTCTIPELHQDPALKTLPVKAKFAGDGFYAASELVPTSVFQTLSTTISLRATPSPLAFGAPLLLSVTVAAHAPATGTPTGTVTFFDNGNQIGEPRTLVGGVATLTVSSLVPGPHRLTATYSGNGTFPPNSAGAPAEAQVQCSRTIEGSHPLEAVIAVIGATCMKNATVLSVTGLPGASVLVENTTVIGAITTSGAGAIRVCGSSTGLLAPNWLTASRGFVEIGDGGDDSGPACAGNTFSGGFAELHIELSSGGVEIGGNKVGALYLNNSIGEGPAPENKRPEIESNEVAGVLSCVNDNPAPTNDGHPNKLAFGGFGQCTGF